VSFGLRIQTVFFLSYTFTTYKTQGALMCNFNKQSDETKAFMHLFMNKAAKNVGGVNFLLALFESIRAYKPHPLTHPNAQIASNKTIIKWSKVVFKDKVDLLQSLLDLHRSSEKSVSNLLDEPNLKKRKKILNMAKALAPVKFQVVPQNPKDGEGFSFEVFEKIEDDIAILNPVFVAIFFCSTEYTKKALKYTL